MSSSLNHVSTRCRFVFSGVASYRKRLEEKGIVGFNELVNFYELSKRPKAFDEINELSTKRSLVFVDSGAWSAFSSKKEIDMKHFIQWQKDLEKECPQIYFKAGLDVIGDWKGSMRNQTMTDDAGLKLFPTYHRGDSDEYLEWVLNRKPEFLGLGGIASGALTEADEIATFLDKAFDAICDSEGNPKIKSHLFGVSNVEFLQLYPGWSNDSTSALFTATYGSIWMPVMGRDGKPNWAVPMTKLVVSSESDARGKKNAHYDTLKPAQQEIVRLLVESRGFDMKRVQTDGTERQCFCHVIMMEQTANYPEDVRFKRPAVEHDIFAI